MDGAGWGYLAGIKYRLVEEGGYAGSMERPALGRKDTGISAGDAAKTAFRIIPMAPNTIADAHAHRPPSMGKKIQ